MTRYDQLGMMDDHQVDVDKRNAMGRYVERVENFKNESSIIGNRWSVKQSMFIATILLLI